MKKRALSFALSMISLFATVAPAFAVETWTCNYKGRWTTNASKNAGDFNWVVYWVKDAKAGWNVLGNYHDRYGFSWFDGDCNNNKCTFNQTYKQGELKGSTYIWKGSYTDKTLAKGKTLNTISGNWGTKDQPVQGKWNAKATCSINPANFDVKKALEK